jgi:hypothetical protein
MMCLIHIDEFTIHVSIAARLSRLCILFFEKLDSLLDCMDNRCMMHGSQNDALDCWCGNQNDICYCCHTTLRDYKYAFRLAWMTISHSSFSRLGFPFLALGLLEMRTREVSSSHVLPPQREVHHPAMPRLLHRCHLGLHCHWDPHQRSPHAAIAYRCLSKAVPLGIFW